MLISRFKILLLIIIIGLTGISCSSVKNAFDPKVKNTSEEFLVEKKTPLSIPPDFEKLPVPKSEKNQQVNSDEIETLLKNTDTKSSKSDGDKSTKLDELILDKIKKN